MLRTNAFVSLPFVLALLGAEVAAHAQAGAFTQLPRLSAPRAGHSATLLADGRVLLAGGHSRWDDDGTDTAEVFDPRTRRFVPVAPMRSTRFSHGALRLPDGRVLVARGFGSYDRAAELYDPVRDVWADAGALAEGCPDGFVAPLRDDRVLYACTLHGVLPEVFDIRARTWSTGPALPSLLDEVIDPPAALEVQRVVFVRTGSGWREAPALASRRMGATVVASRDGSIFFIGGMALDTLPGAARMPRGLQWHGLAATASVERCDPSTATSQVIGRMRAPRVEPESAVLPDGRVLIVGGTVPRFASDEERRRALDEACEGVHVPDAPIASAEIFDPATGRWTPAGRLARARTGATMTVLPDGCVLVAGGETRNRRPLADADLWCPHRR